MLRFVNSDSCPISLGITPVIALEKALKTCKDESSPISDGIEPEKLLIAGNRRKLDQKMKYCVSLKRQECMTYLNSHKQEK